MRSTSPLGFDYNCKSRPKTDAPSHGFLMFFSRFLILFPGDKPHVCEVCNKSFALACNLKAHMKTHEEGGGTSISGADEEPHRATSSQGGSMMGSHSEGEEESSNPAPSMHHPAAVAAAAAFEKVTKEQLNFSKHLLFSSYTKQMLSGVG